MNRRGFLSSILALGAAPAVVRAESLMRVSGIVIPTTAEVLAVSGNSLLTCEIITRESIKLLEENLLAATGFNRSFDEQFASIGKTLTIRRPVRYTLIPPS